MIHQFTHEFAAPRYWVDEREGRQAILGRTPDEGQRLDYQTYRLGFRDVASSTNERTMIATIIPPNVFAGNTLAVSKEGMSGAEMLFVASCLSSFTFDAMIRKRVTSHCNFFYVYGMPVPRLTAGQKYFSDIVTRAAKLICTTPEFDELAQSAGLGSHADGVTDAVERAQLRAELDGMVAHLYGLTKDDFAHILSTFPLVDDAIKDAALNAM
jgi:hypothetical protein